MKNEGSFWTKVRNEFHKTPRQRLRRFTDNLGPGAPDGLYTANGVTGVLELKYLPRWPVRAGTKIKVGKDGLSEPQRMWLEDWEACGGRAHVLLGVDQEWFLLRLHEVPEDNYITRLALDAIRRDGRAGMMRDLKRLSVVLTGQLEPVA